MPHIPVYGKRKLLKLNMVSVCTWHEIRLGNDKLCMSVKKRVAGLRGCLNKPNRSVKHVYIPDCSHSEWLLCPSCPFAGHLNTYSL